MTGESNSYRRALEHKQAELERGLRRLDGIAVERAADEMDEVWLATERDLAVTDLDRKTELLIQVRAALARVADGSYGECLSCGEEIRPARLAAVPWAPHCIRCQEAIDNGRQRAASVTRSLGEAA